MSLTSVQKKITIIFVVKSLKGFGWNNVGLPVADGSPTLFHNWANVSCYPGSGLSGEYSVTRMAVRANTGQSPNCVSMLGLRHY